MSFSVLLIWRTRTSPRAVRYAPVPPVTASLCVGDMPCSVEGKSPWMVICPPGNIPAMRHSLVKVRDGAVPVMRVIVQTPWPSPSRLPSWNSSSVKTAWSPRLRPCVPRSSCAESIVLAMNRGTSTTAHSSRSSLPPHCAIPSGDAMEAP